MRAKFILAVVLALVAAALGGELMWGDQIVWGDQIIWGDASGAEYIVWGN